MIEINKERLSFYFFLTGVPYCLLLFFPNLQNYLSQTKKIILEEFD